MLLAYRLRVLSDTDLQLSCYAVDIRKGGRWAGTPFPLYADKLIAGKGPNQIRLAPIDRKILMSMMMHQKTGGSEALFRGANTSRVLEHLIHSGRAYPEDRNARPLAPAREEKAGAPGWASAEDLLKPVLELPEHLDLIPGVPCYALDRKTGGCAELRTSVDARAVWAWITSPPMPVKNCGAFLEDMGHRYPRAEFPPPPSLHSRRVRDLVPVPLGVFQARDGATRLPDRLELHFRYDQARIVHEASGEQVRWIRGKSLFQADRDPEAERRAEEELVRAGLLREAPREDDLFTAASKTPFFLLDSHRHRDWSAFVAHVHRTLAHWEWELPPSLRPKSVDPEDWYLEYDKSSTGQFKYQQGVIVDGKRINLLPVLNHFLLLRKGLTREEILREIGEDTCPLSTEQGLLLIPSSRLRRMVETLFELYSPAALDASGRLTMGEWRAGELYEENAEGWKPSPTLRSQIEGLRDGLDIRPLEPPQTFCGELRPYQKTGLGWLDFLHTHRLGGVLADDMGLGKTIQVIAAFLRMAETAPLRALVVCPTSVLPNWAAELEKFAPSLSCIRHHGSDREGHPDPLASPQVVLTTYGVLRRDEELLSATPYDVIVLDEAQYVKNPRTRSSRAVRRIPAGLRLALSGTPLENHLGELRSLLDFALPGYLGTETQFNQTLRHPIEQHGDTRAKTALTTRVAPLLLRRSKDQVATDLPPKTEIRTEVDLTESQADAYEVVRAAGEESLHETLTLQGFERSRIQVLDLLLKLRQVCCDPRLLPGADPSQKADAAKRAWLRDALPEMIEEGRRILLFSQFTSMLDLLKPELEALRIPYVELRGTTRDRETPVQTFQAGKVPLFLISLKAGGTGLNLTAADTVIFHDPWWNPAVEKQAEDRAHRIGQDKPVFIYKLICRGTVEERILALQQKKKDLGALLSTDTSSSIRLTREDLNVLLAPLHGGLA